MTTENEDVIPFKQAQALAETEGDPFRHSEPIAGLEHLGRAICDQYGQPSGSPANYETLRGAGGDQAPTTLRPLAEVTNDIKTLFEAEFTPGQLDPMQPAE